MNGFEGRGYAREAAIRARAYAYDTLGWNEIASCIYEGNHSSIRLGERMGAHVERRMKRDGRPDMLVYRHPSPAELALGL
jgi:RimJ/RimL family protein N-acetyltransferase